MATYNGSTGNDTTSQGGSGSDVFNAYGGDDSINAGGGNDTVFGGDGNDLLDGSFGNDSIYGGAGNDTLRGGADNDVLDGGLGNDTIYGDAGGDTGYGGGGDDVMGSYNADSAGDDTFYGGDGNDTLTGGGENDVLYGDAGNDVISGGIGADTLYGGADRDIFYISEDHQTDTIFGGETGDDNDGIGFGNYLTSQGISVTFNGAEAGTYNYFGGGATGSFSQIETVWGTGNSDNINATNSTAAQRLGGDSGNDTLTGGSGADEIFGGTGNDTIIGNAGNDTFYGEAGNDSQYGGDGADSLFGGTGDDLLSGGNNNDVAYGDDGADSIDGGAGSDTLFGGAGDDRLAGGDGDDTLYGDTGSNTLWGDAGNDSLYGSTEADTLYGGDGHDRLDSGAGNDVIFFGAGNDSVYGGDGDDVIDDIGGGALTGDNYIEGGAGNDVIFFGAGNDTVYGGTGDDVIDDTGGGQTNGTTTIFGGDGDDIIYGSSGGADTIYGDAGNDLIYGENGLGTLYGGSGNDTLIGGASNDILTGGTGNDTLTGGAGHDRFFLDSAGGADIVTDFSLTDSDGDGHYDDQIDVSDLTNGAGGPVTAWDVVVTDDGFGNAKLTFPEGETLVLQGISPTQMATAGQRHAAGIPCFAAGTMIRTPLGEVAVEGLRPGDLVTTLDHGPQPVLWAGARHLSATDLAQMPHLRPVRLTKSCTGTGRDLLVSPQHAVLLPQAHSLVRAVHLARRGTTGARIALGLRRVSYVHLMFARHEIIFANDTLTESFYPGPWGLAMLDPTALGAIARRFPALATHGAARAYGPTARPILRYADVQRTQVSPALCLA